MKLREAILLTNILIISVVVLGLGYVLSRQFTKLLTERMVDDYRETAVKVQRNIETLILYTQDFAKYTSQDEAVLDTLMEYENTLEEDDIRYRMQLQNQWKQISIRLLYSTSMLDGLDIYAGNELLYSYYEDSEESPNKNIPSDILEKATNQTPPVWTDLLTLKQKQSYSKKENYAFAVVKSVRTKLGESLGAIVVYVRESSFSDLLVPTDQMDKNRFYLVSGDNTILSAVDKSELYGDAVEILGLTEEEYRKCLEEEIFLKERRGEASILYMSNSVGDRGMKLICETHMDELVEQQQNLRIFTGILMAFAIMMAGIGSWHASQRVTKPLGELMDLMEKIKDGGADSNLRFPNESTGEIGVLGERFNELMDRLDEMRNQIYKEQRQRRHNELRLLQAQLSPHFLYNTLGVISSFVKLGMSGEALVAIQNLVNFYRLSLSSGRELITVREEAELTKNYMELQRLRYVEYMEYMLECEEKVENFALPKLTIQPLVENVLQHGLKPGGKCLINIRFAPDETGDGLKICVYDNGAGMKEERLLQVRKSLEAGESITESFGILNVDQRLRLLYGKAYHMEIESKEGSYTRITLHIREKIKGGETGDV